MAANYRTQNSEKTQLLWVGSGNKCQGVTIGGTTVAPVDKIEVQGLVFDWRLKVGAHLKALTTAASSKACMAQMNDAARPVCDTSMARSHPVAYLVRDTGFPSVNWLVIRSIAIEAWKALG